MWGMACHEHKGMSAFDLLCFNRQADNSHDTHTHKKTTPRGTCRHTGTSWSLIEWDPAGEITEDLLEMIKKMLERRFK
jgi:hypothetical protein